MSRLTRAWGWTLLAGIAVGGGLLTAALFVGRDATPLPSPTTSESLTPVQEVLQGIGLQASDLPNGWRAVVPSLGNRLVGPTLDVCGASFPSEAKRLVRRFTESVDGAGVAGTVATDVVQYESPAAALEALAEVMAAAPTCATGELPLFSELEVTALPTTPDAFAGRVGNPRLGPPLRNLLWEVRGNVLVILSLEVSPSESDDAEEWSEFQRLAGLVTDRLNAVDPVEIGYF